jgi:hypothetical protein
MARLNEILVGRFNRGLQKLFGIKGPPPVATLAPEIMPIFAFPSGVEDRYTQQWDRYAASVSVAAQGAAANGARIRNPAGSNVIAVLEKLLITTSIAETFNAGFTVPGTADLAISGPAAASIDGRQPKTAACLVSSSITTPGVTNVMDRVSLPAGQSFDLILFEDQEITVTPGTAWDVVTNAVNSLITVSWTWRERFLEEGERL